MTIDPDRKIDLLDDMADDQAFLDADAVLVAYLNGESLVYGMLGDRDTVRDLRRRVGGIPI